MPGTLQAFLDRVRNSSCGLVLFRPQIPPNTGNISRLAVGGGVPLLLSGRLGFSLAERRLLRAGLDYWDHLELFLDEEEEFFLSSRPNLRIFSTRGKTIYTDVNYPVGSFLVFGNEVQGLEGSYYRRFEEHLVTIPQKSISRAYNLSNAVAIGLMEVLRQQGFPGLFPNNSA